MNRKEAIAAALNQIDAAWEWVYDNELELDDISWDSSQDTAKSFIVFVDSLIQES